MDLYMVIKVCKQCYRIVVMNLTAKYNGKNRKNICIVGNLPELYYGMTISLDLRNNVAVNYNVTLTDKNIAILKKNGIDEAEYQKALNVHGQLKKENYDWNAYKYEISQVYKNLPFGKADKLHKIIVDNAIDENRLNAINDNIIKTARLQHKLAYSINDYVNFFEGIENCGAYDKLPMTAKIRCLCDSCYGFKSNMVYDTEMKNKTVAVQANIANRMANEYPLLHKYEIDSFLYTLRDNTFEKEQLKVLECLVDSCPCVITGKAGTGKTSVIKLVIDCYTRYYGTNDILLIAPTGKASRRLEEKTGMPSSTIHKALRKKPDDDFVFYNADNPLPHKLIIVDESSMIDTLLMYDLLNAVSPYGKIIFAGDHNQLEPVGCGEPFFDFLKILPVNYLTINHRQAEDTEILDVANGILEGQSIRRGKGVTVSYIHYEAIEKVLDYLKNTQKEESYQIISPYNKLNYQINSYLKKGDKPFNIGDKVIMTRNTESYCNGDIGYIKSLEVNEEERNPLNYKKRFHMQIDIEGKTVEITDNEWEDVSLAYAITVHKMQGSESERIIVFSPYNERCLGNKRLMYTAATRARKELDFVLFR